MGTLQTTASGVVLVGDDDAPTLTLADSLERAGLPVRMAVSARMALSEIARGAEVVVCDLGAAQMHSIEVLLCLRKARVTPPVVVVSAMPNVEQHCQSLGVQHYLEHPFRLSDLVAMIDRVTGRDSMVPIPLVLRAPTVRMVQQMA